MKTIYNECLGNTEMLYAAFTETDEETKADVYGILVRDNRTHKEKVLHSFSATKEQAIDFIETLVRNIVSPDFVEDIAEDYLVS